MTLRRLFMLAGILLILFLGVYSWNRRTHVLDDLAANVGLEASYFVLGPLEALRESGGAFWERYFDLVGVREENLRLKAEVDDLKAKLLARGEDVAELARLRALVDMPIDANWRPIGCRVLSGRLGPNAVLDSVTISRGYANGARPGMPLVTNLGLVGKVLRASPHAATVLLVTDPKSRVAVFGQETRAPGILKGKGISLGMEVDFVQRDLPVKNGEVLVTSGLDGKYPKGLPVARVQNVVPSDYTQFMAVSATPLVDLKNLEEALLLEKTGVELFSEEAEDPLPEFVGPPLPPKLEKARLERAAAQKTAQAARNPAQANQANNSQANPGSPQANPANTQANTGNMLANQANRQASPANNAQAQQPGSAGVQGSPANASRQPAPRRRARQAPNPPAANAANAASQPGANANPAANQGNANPEGQGGNAGAARPVNPPNVNTPPARGHRPALRPAKPAQPVQPGQEIPRNAEGAPKWRVITP